MNLLIGIVMVNNHSCGLHTPFVEHCLYFVAGIVGTRLGESKEMALLLGCSFGTLLVHHADLPLLRAITGYLCSFWIVRFPAISIIWNVFLLR